MRFLGKLLTCEMKLLLLLFGTLQHWRVIDDYLSSKNIVLKDNSIIVQPDIIGLKFIYIADELMVS